MEQIFLQLKCFLDVTILFDNNYKHFYNMCTQSSENQLFPLPEKEDSEQQQEGIEIGSGIVLMVPAYKNIFSWAVQNHPESPQVSPVCISKKIVLLFYVI